MLSPLKTNELLHLSLVLNIFRHRFCTLMGNESVYKLVFLSSMNCAHTVILFPLCILCKSISSQSRRLLMSPLAFSNAVASHPIVSLPSAWLFSIHARSISRMISSVLVLLFMRNRLIFSTEKPSSKPSWRYSVDTLSATASSSSGNTWTFFIRVTGCSCCAKSKKGRNINKTKR